MENPYTGRTQNLRVVEWELRVYTYMEHNRQESLEGGLFQKLGGQFRL